MPDLVNHFLGTVAVSFYSTSIWPYTSFWTVILLFRLLNALPCHRRCGVVNVCCHECDHAAIVFLSPRSSITVILYMCTSYST